MRARTLVLMLISAFALAGTPVHAEMYSRNLEDLNWHLSLPITPIGDLGRVSTIIDLRGFVPLSMASKTKSIWWDVYRWYRFPTMQGIALAYYGDTAPETLAKLSAATVLTEEQLKGEQLDWARFAYLLAKTSGTDLFASAGGTPDELESAEPIAILLTQRSAIVIMNFRYANYGRKGTGQILCGLEFSRRLKEYKTFYKIHATFIWGRSVKSSFTKSVPYVAKALAAYSVGN